MRRYRFHPEARAELRAAIEWYGARPEISAELAATVETTVRRIRQTPRAYARWPAIENAEVRRCVLRRFPFVVIYLVDDRGILVLAVAHTSRDPAYWMRRLER